jgi:hypothetical protein
MRSMLNGSGLLFEGARTTDLETEIEKVAQLVATVDQVTVWAGLNVSSSTSRILNTAIPLVSSI